MPDDDEPELIEADDASLPSKPAAAPGAKPQAPAVVAVDQVTNPDAGAAADADIATVSATTTPAVRSRRTPRGGVAAHPRADSGSVIARGSEALSAIRERIEQAADVLADPLAMAVHALGERERGHVLAVLGVLARIEAERSRPMSVAAARARGAQD